MKPQWSRKVGGAGILCIFWLQYTQNKSESEAFSPLKMFQSVSSQYLPLCCLSAALPRVTGQISHLSQDSLTCHGSADNFPSPL